MLLALIFSILFLGIFLILVRPSNDLFFTKTITLFTSSLVLILSTVLVIDFDNNLSHFQSVTHFSIGSDLLNINYSFGLDGISILFFFLSAILIFLCVLFIWNDNLFKEYALNLLLIELFLFIIFSVLDLFLFYVFFEAILIPMYLMIGVFGSRERKIRAVYLFFFYTLCGSILMLLGILYIYSVVGTLNLEILLTWNFSKTEQLLLWLAFFISFSSKIPMFPFHIWLPEAHVEAPTVGSVLLAGILLKLGVYGFLRFSLTLFPDASFFFSPLVYLLSIIGIIYASMSAIRQTDLKKIIAYSSVAHMNLVTLGLFSYNCLGVEGAILQSVSHGFVSGGMFLLVGVIYNRYHSRFLYYYGGLVQLMPLYALFFLVFTMANIALPGTSSFVGEFLLLTGVFKVNVIICTISALGVILCGAYSLWLCNRILFGNLKSTFTVHFSDLNMREIVILTPLLIFIIFLGFYPTVFLSFIHLSTVGLTLITT